MRVSRMLVVVVVVVLFGAFVASASATDVTGSWAHQEYDFTSSGGNAGGYSGVNDEITLEDTSGGFSGTNDSESDPLLGNVASDGVTLDFWVKREHDPGSLAIQVFHGTLNGAGNIITGYSAICAYGDGKAPREVIYQANFVMSLPKVENVPTPSLTPPGQPALELCDEEPLPPGPDFRHATSTALQCFRGPTPGDDSTCVATVTDEGTPAETPSSAVNFTVSPGGGSLPDGSQCTLAASTATSGSPGTCQITYAPPPGGLAEEAVVPIQATYIGDSDHKPSSVAVASSVAGKAPPPSTLTPIQISAPGLGTLPQCENYGAVSGNVNIPPGDYTGPNGEYGAKAQNALSCSLLATAALVSGGKWVTANLAGVLESANAGSRFEQTFQTFIETENGYIEVDAQIHPWATSQNRAQTTGVHDPPASSFTTLVKVKPAKLPLIRVSGNAKTRSNTKTLNTWLKELALSRGLADAFTQTVNRAGGAKAAGNTAWEGRQIRLAITLSKELSAADTALIPLTQKIAALAATSPLAKRGLSVSALQRIRKKIASSGLSKTQRAHLKKLGYDAAELAAVVAAAKDTSVPTSTLLSTPAQALASPQLISEMRTFALFFELWPDRPEVLTAAAH
jgi:hypothetical protein